MNKLPNIFTMSIWKTVSIDQLVLPFFIYVVMYKANFIYLCGHKVKNCLYHTCAFTHVKY